MAKDYWENGSGAFGLEIKSRNNLDERKWFSSQAKRDQHAKMLDRLMEASPEASVTYTKIHRMG